MKRRSFIQKALGLLGVAGVTSLPSSTQPEGSSTSHKGCGDFSLCFTDTATVPKGFTCLFETYGCHESVFALEKSSDERYWLPVLTGRPIFVSHRDMNVSVKCGLWDTDMIVRCRVVHNEDGKLRTQLLVL